MTEPDLASASQMWRLANCEGSKNYVRSLREAGILRKILAGPEATIGTRIHAFLEGLPEDLHVTEEEIASACERLASLVVQQTWNCTDAKIAYEQRLTYRISDVPFFTGKPDRVYFEPSDGPEPLDAININFKTGRLESIESHLNLQLRTENVLIKHSFPSIQQIAAAIVEPMVSFKPNVVIYDEAALKEAESEILEIVDKAEWGKKRTPGEWCGHCPARAWCPEAKEMALGHPLKIDVKALPRGQAASELLTRIETGYKVLDAIWEAYKTICLEELGAVPGWHVSEGSDVRYIKDIARLHEIAGEYDIATTDLVKTTVPIGKLEERAKKALKLTGKAFDKKFDELFWTVIGKTHKAGPLQRIPKNLLK
ncbi:MAG TPA: DUF2800 domain-containing protein [Chthoniobacterales bacterium]|nr:DUF2800 domain-containing protein [Chthoniobacterales bacterium]